jgi:hypothetical protein
LIDSGCLVAVEGDATLDSRAEMVFWAAVSCTYNELESSAADSSLLESVISLRNSSLMTEEDGGAILIIR